MYLFQFLMPDGTIVNIMADSCEEAREKFLIMIGRVA